VQAKLATLSLLERLAGSARKLGLGRVVERTAPFASRPFERFVLDVDSVRLAGADLAQLHYVRELRDLGRERTFVRLLVEAIPVGGAVVEGGAHLGFVTIHAARAVGPHGRVTVFEPNPEVIGVLRENLRANRVADRVQVITKALGDTTGMAPFFVRADESSLYVPTGDADATEVEVVRADELIDTRVDVVKLDVEGAEMAALRGMEGVLTGDAPPRALFLECNPVLLERSGSSAAELLAWVEARGYEIEWIDEANGRAASVSEPWTAPYVNLRCTRRH
jgi:FkbM family methyltransferase